MVYARGYDHNSIPIVFSVGDAVEPGLVASLARPGQPHGRQLPRGRTVAQDGRAAVRIGSAGQGGGAAGIRILRATLSTRRRQRARKGVQLRVLQAGIEREVETAFTSLAQSQSDALVIGGDPFLSTRRAQLVALGRAIVFRRSHSRAKRRRREANTLNRPARGA